MELQELRALGLAARGAVDDRDLSSNWFSLQVGAARAGSNLQHCTLAAASTALPPTRSSSLSPSPKNKTSQSAQRVYNTFHSWDADGNGTLSRPEFSRISQGTMSELFIARVFEEHVAAPRGDVWPPPADPFAAASPARLQRQRTPGREAGADPVSSGGGGVEHDAAAAAAEEEAAEAAAADGDESPGPSSPQADLPKLGLRLRMAGGDGVAASSGGGGGSPGGASAAKHRRRQQQGGAAAAVAAAAAAAGACTRDEMDMMAFVDFVLAWDHRNHPAALAYFFSIFDLQHKVRAADRSAPYPQLSVQPSHLSAAVQTPPTSPPSPPPPPPNQGYLTHPDLYTFFREVHAMWVAMGEYADLCVHDVLDEVMDMAAPATAGRVTLKVGGCRVDGGVGWVGAEVGGGEVVWPCVGRDAWCSFCVSDGA